jgi:predicted metal-dependent phosphoesterase TrpH
MNISMISSTTNLVLAPDAAVDLQLHTIYSDGSWTPEQLMDYLRNERFGLAAITDHDRADTVTVLQQLALDKHLPVLIAVEMTTLWRGEMTDILCFGFDPDRNALNDLARDILRRQCENTQEVYENLQQRGHIPKHSIEELTTLLGKPSSQQPHELVALLKRHMGDTGEASAGKIVWEAGCKFATNDIAAVVEAAHQSGAVCLIAHPGREDGFVTYDAQLLDQLRREVPIDGLEVYYPVHTPAQTAMYLDYAQKHRLLTSSGSDSHNPDKKPIKYRADLSRDLLERVGIQIKA